MYEMTLRHTFVTDGLYPSPTYRKRLDDPHGTRDGAAMSSPIAAGEIYTKRDLESADSQPIKPQHGPQSQKYTVETIAMDTDSTSTPMTDEFTMKLTTMGMLCLADYLDLDSDPLSLALPCCERRPMIAGIQPLISADYPLTLKSTMDPLETQDDRVISEMKPGDQTRMVERTVTVNFDEDQLAMLLQSGAVHLDVVYPFTVPEDNPVDYAVEGKLAFFFTDERGGAPTLRTSPNGSTDVIGSTSDPLHIKDENSMRGGFQPEKGVFSVAFGGRNDMNSWFKFNEAPKTEADAVKDTTKAPQMLATDFSTISTIVSGFKAKPLVKLTYQWMQTLDKKTGLWQPKYNSVLGDASKLTEVKFGLKPLSVAQGYTPDTANYTDEVALSRMAAGGDINVKLNLALWARLVECGQSGRVVDMVPACMLDDMVQNAEPFNSGMAAAVMYFNGPNYPIMRFDTGVTLRLGFKDLLKIIEGEISEQKVTVDPAAAICLDPRFNYAPEHWLGITPSVRDDGWLTKEDWLNAVQEFCQKTTGRDPDIFMATSDQGYLQSPYELAFLPRFTDLYKWEGLFTGSDSITGYYRNPSYSLRTSLTKKEKDGFSQIENVDLMWNSYDPFGRDRDAFADLGVTARGHGIKVNPYSDSTNILMAAFANTPSSWRFASTNNQQHALEDLTAQQFNSRFAMNGYESDEKEHVYMPWVTLNEIAGRFSSAVRSGNGDWESAFERMDWTSDPNSLCGVALDQKTPTLWGVDRKFLYGFWRDCFSADQQLFLIFVRAEPSMMGGEITGQVPPNLGARAVALVWRDPRECLETPVGDYPIPGYPHRTRILFYHSLD